MKSAKRRHQRRRRALRQEIYNCKDCFCLDVKAKKAMKCPKHGFRFLSLPLRKEPFIPFDFSRAYKRGPWAKKDDNAI